MAQIHDTETLLFGICSEPQSMLRSLQAEDYTQFLTQICVMDI